MTCVILIINKKSHTSKELWKIFKKCKIFRLQLYNAMTCVILIINKKSHTSKELWKIFKNVKIYNMFHQQLFISS